MPAARNVIDGILMMSAQTFLNSLATNIQKLLMYVTLALKSEPVFWEHYIYNAKKAHRLYEQTLSKSREGINMTPEELQELNDLISPLILKGQPLSHIFAVHADEIPVCRRTLYNYLDQRVFQAHRIIMRWADVLY